MTGENDLTTLLASMSPELRPGRYCFAHVPTLAEAARVNAVMTFQETEAVTLILPFKEAEAAGLTTEFECCWITLNIHSSLDAVGFMARIATRLAALGMGVNPVAGFYHDHLFVPFDRAEEAIAALRTLARDTAQDRE